jgi:hypothetical protein
MEEGLARERAPRTGSSSKGIVVIRNGLDAGDKLITLGEQNGPTYNPEGQDDPSRGKGHF